MSCRAPRYASTTRFVAADLIRCSVRDHAAVVHHDHAVARPHDEVEVVLDDEERDAVAIAEREDVLEQLHAERRADSRHRLVEEQDRRLGHQCANQVEQLPLAPGERPGERIGVSVEADQREQLVLRGVAPRARERVRQRRRRAARPGAAAPRARRSRARSCGSACAASGTCGRARPARSGAARAGRSAARRGAHGPTAAGGSRRRS